MTAKNAPNNRFEKKIPEGDLATVRIANCAQRQQASAGAGETIRADLH